MGIELCIEDGVARVTIDRPHRMNAVDRQSAGRLVEIWDGLEQRGDIRCVVLTGSGDKAFSAGADMNDDSGLSGEDYWRALSDDLAHLPMRRGFHIPVIARVNGLALGGGFELVMGCDIVLAADHAKFGLPEAKVGRLPLDGGMVHLPRLLPRKIAMGMMMTGRMLSAAEVAHYGLVNAVVPMEDLDAELEIWISQIKSSAPLSIKAIKSVHQVTAHMEPGDAYRTETPELIAALNSEDAEEGVSAFREKRTPNWRGR